MAAARDVRGRPARRPLELRRDPIPASAKIRKILVANRGEIAVRVIRACRDLGIASVAVYSEVDRAALHVQMADEAYPLGAAAARESYLNISRVIEAARRSGAQAVHPGYGFLSENPEFAQACADAELIFIGPSAVSMRQLGSKTAARELARRHDVPMLAGAAALPTLQEALREAERAGFPVMLKASAGGGGKGMRRVERAQDLAGAYQLARTEAQSAFGDDTVYLERALDRPRHVEIQILADRRGNTIYLGERECSVQRRHQKIIEESPSARLSPQLRARMGDAAVRVARAAGYENAGTVEFLLDESGGFYFLEVNTRLQVEHPVTEMVAGIDMVAAQIQIAEGAPLPWRQEDIQPRGHAIECRIYAEDPANNFFPSPGRIAVWETPSGPGVRVDSGVYEGWQVPLEYDPLLAKLIAWGADRPEALRRLRRALGEFHISGIRHNLPFFRRALDDSTFTAGDVDTSFVERLLAQPRDLESEAAATRELENAAALAGALSYARQSQLVPESPAPSSSNWQQTARREGLR